MFLQNRRTEECGRAVGAAEGRTKERGKPAMVEKVVTKGYLVMVINDGVGGLDWIGETPILPVIWGMWWDWLSEPHH